MLVFLRKLIGGKKITVSQHIIYGAMGRDAYGAVRQDEIPDHAATLNGANTNRKEYTKDNEHSVVHAEGPERCKFCANLDIYKPNATFVMASCAKRACEFKPREAACECCENYEFVMAHQQYECCSPHGCSFVPKGENE